MINDLPTIFEVVTGIAKKQAKVKSSVSNNSNSKSKSNSKVVTDLYFSNFQSQNRYWSCRLGNSGLCICLNNGSCLRLHIILRTLYQYAR